MASAGCRRWKATSPRRRSSSLSDRMFSRRYRRGPHQGGQAPPLRRDRPHLEVRVRPLHRQADRPTAAVSFLETLLEAAPYRLHNDPHRQWHPVRRSAEEPRRLDRTLPVHRFDQICRENDIEHRLTKPNHPWTNGQVERMNSPSRTPPSSATTTTAATIIFASTFSSSSTPTIMRVD